MPSKTLPPKPRSIAAKKTISIVASLYNEDLVNSLLDSTVHGLRALIPGITVNIYRVPGAFEIPVCAKKLIESNNIDVMIALGVIIKGETSHAELVGSSVTQSLQEIATNFNTPIIHEVLLTENREQAIERCKGDKNRGTEAAKAAATMSELFTSLDAANKRTPQLS
ncbi:MAG: 6,7-dimethyl-8-ribityllumazine synthase [Verrucomicrobiales bacterium]